MGFRAGIVYSRMGICIVTFVYTNVYFLREDSHLYVKFDSMSVEKHKERGEDCDNVKVKCQEMESGGNCETGADKSRSLKNVRYG